MARRRRLTTGQKLSIGAAALVFLGFAAWLYGGDYMRQRDLAFSRAAEAKVDGPPCPTVTVQAFAAKRLKAPKRTNYEGVIFGRQFGHMDCRTLRYGAGWGTAVYPACQFTSPNVLTVTTDKGTWRFHPGAGQPATIATPHGEARCVMGSNFRLPR
jgi:hypothetical protein